MVNSGLSYSQFELEDDLLDSNLQNELYFGVHFDAAF